MKIRRLTDTGEWTTRRYLSLLGNILIWVIVAIDAWYLWPTQLHGSTSMVIVSGHSMEPTFFTGDLVIARKLEPSVGDVIVYAPASLGGSQIVHRIIGGNATDGWQMQGDNNNFIDPFTPKGSEVRGVVLVHYANFGRVTVLLLNPIVWAFVLLAAVVLLVWWGGDTCEDDPDDDDNGDSASGGEPELGTAVVADGPNTSESPPGDDPVNAGDSAADAEREPALAAVPAPTRALARLASKPVRAITATMVGLLALAFSATPASASKLTVVPASEISVMSDSKCATQNLEVTASGVNTGNAYSEVTVSAIAANCLNKPITVYMHNSVGTVIATLTGTTPATGSTMTLSLAPPTSFDASQVNKVVVKVSGWLFLATWTAPPVSIPGFSCVPVNNGGNVPGGKSCNVTNVMVTQWQGGAGNQYQYKKVTFTATSGAVDFLVTFDFGDAASFGTWPAGSPTRVWSNGNAIKATVPAPAYSCASLPTVSLNRNVPINPPDAGYEIQVSNDPNAFAGAVFPSAVCP